MLTTYDSKNKRLSMMIDGMRSIFNAVQKIFFLLLYKFTKIVLLLDVINSFIKTLLSHKDRPVLRRLTSNM